MNTNISGTPFAANRVPPCEVGDRIELRRMDDFNAIPEGTFGTVLSVTKVTTGPRQYDWHIQVDWDNGRRLAVIYPKDTIRRLPPQQQPPKGWSVAG